MRIAHIRIRPPRDSLADLEKGFLVAWKQGRYRGEFIDFESPAALFQVLTPKRWKLVEGLQAQGPLGARALARALGRDVKRVHEDVKVLAEYRLLEKDAEGKWLVPFGEIRADFALRAAA